MFNADIHILYESSFCRISDFRCKCSLCSTSEPEYQKRFAISYIRKGNFVYNVFRNSLDAFNGKFLIDKPGFEHTVCHFHSVPDECTNFSFDESFYDLLKDEYKIPGDNFFIDNDVQSLLVKANAETEFLHAAIIKSLKSNSSNRMLIESLLIELVRKVLDRINIQSKIEISPSLRRFHLRTIEAAKQYIHDNFEIDISLFDIARNCFVSPFHFSRIFKSFTGTSPYQYLMETRLKNADILLKNTSLPITQICFTSGFNSLDHFSVSFKKKYGIQPSKLRNRKYDSIYQPIFKKNVNQILRLT